MLEKLEAVILDAVFEALLFAVGQLLDCSPLVVEEMFPMVVGNFLMMWSFPECAALLVTPQVVAHDVVYGVPLFAEGQFLGYSPAYFEEMLLVIAASFIVMCVAVLVTLKVATLDVVKTVLLYAVGQLLHYKPSHLEEMPLMVAGGVFMILP